jgi:hypothetical protein
MLRGRLQSREAAREVFHFFSWCTNYHRKAGIPKECFTYSLAIFLFSRKDAKTQSRKEQWLDDFSLVKRSVVKDSLTTAKAEKK